ncbi:hypothetical protein CI238_12472 [Colletotrichum incanum]|uniref:Uncharacterized protein n=1 Tax=Colletotrichum incanum TaxID=1573173 RepID=A0A167BSN2_COLIC|nr:hypothetical protein CI238_12472 [Colletotrichum incanum]
MQILPLVSFATLTTIVAADLHSSGYCVTKKPSLPSVVLPRANRNTGNKQWDQCLDCTFDGLQCNSAGKHIGGDELYYYCTKKCGAQGSEGN